MPDNAHGRATDAVSIRRNAILAIITSIELIFLNVKKLKFSHQAFVLHLIFIIKEKICRYVEYNTHKYLIESCQLNIVSDGINSVLDTPDL